jgi:hypothetical protein
MAFDTKKPKRAPGPPDYRQNRVLDAIDRSFAELTSVLLQASNNDPAMREIVASLGNSVNQARTWVMTN